MPVSAKDVLKRALVVLDRDGWCQGEATNNTGQHCLVGLLGVSNREANGVLVGYEGLSEGLVPLLKVSIGPVADMSLSEWNDTPGRTIEEVRAALIVATQVAV